MKIIKQGKTKEELKVILNKTRRFECKTCGCIFEADEDEYEVEEDYIYSTFYCKCPNCGNNAFEVKMRETGKISKKCYDDRCCHHMFSDTCGLNCAHAQWPAYEILTGSQCPYYMRREEPEPGAFSERDR